MKCVYCGYEESKVTDKRDLDESIRRRRECLKCNRRYTTYETLESDSLMILKKDGTKEAFNREKLLRGIGFACQKLHITSEQIEQLVERIEQTVHKQDKKLVKSSVLGSLVARKLKVLDKLAYLRFASVYKEFENIDEVKQELEKLEVK